MRLVACPLAVALLATWACRAVLAQEEAAPTPPETPADTPAAPADAPAPPVEPPAPPVEPPATPVMPPPPPPPPSTPAAPKVQPKMAKSTAEVPPVPRKIDDYVPADPESIKSRKAEAMDALQAAGILYSEGMWVYSDMGGYTSDEGPVECAQRCEDLPDCHHWNFDCRTSECEFKGEHGYWEDGDPQFGRDKILTGESKRKPEATRRLGAKVVKTEPPKQPKEL
mmetsp:Transcript_152045/g.265006  ORF Transcript_152045/g.265006 Transcript_152045/m.265006 type:complete len:225 (-) Transcript_152045:57-731(-)